MRLTLSFKYIIATTIIILVIMGITLSVISMNHEKLLVRQTEMQAKALFQQIVVTRRWVAEHGGIFIEELPWLRESTFGKNPQRLDYRGRRYIRQNPSTITRELSEYAQKERNYFFHITSLKLINPDNAPDDFERKSLQLFEKKEVVESSTIQMIGKSFYFRYIAPLPVEQSCLECHRKQGYAVGDIIGAISVSVPMDTTFAIIESSRKFMVIGGFTTLVVLMSALFLITRHMVIKPINKIRTMMIKFSNDGNPDVPMLKTNDELEDLSKSFQEMAQSISGYHTNLKGKIESATRELKEKNESLLRLSRVKSDSVAKISHELRTPLTSIKGAMDYLAARLAMQKNDDQEEFVVFFEVIKKNAERLIRLVNNVLDYERIEFGKLAMNFKEMNLKTIFDEVLLDFKSQALEKDVNIQLMADNVIARVDEDRIRQVLINLISNALNFSPHSSQIAISLEEDAEYAYVRVLDNGCGIAESEKEVIFNQFYSKGVKNGTGLGLAICKGIIEAHSGEIGFQAGQNAGCCFYFKLPKTGER